MKTMKRIIIVLLAIVAMSAPQVEARTYALLAGISNYGGEDQGDNTTNTNDVKALRKILGTQTKDITMLTSRYANADNIIEKLRAITHRAQEGDRIIFFFTGHGFPGGMLCYQSNLYYSRLVQELSDTRASEVFVFVDACFSGSAGNDVSDSSNWLEGLKPQKGHVYMLSSRGDESSWGGGWLNKSLFTQALITGMRGKADTDHNRGITVMELFKHIHKDVYRRSDGEQHPVMIAPRSMHDVELIRYSADSTDYSDI